MLPQQICVPPLIFYVTPYLIIKLPCKISLAEESYFQNLFVGTFYAESLSSLSNYSQAWDTLFASSWANICTYVCAYKCTHKILAFRCTAGLRFWFHFNYAFIQKMSLAFELETLVVPVYVYKNNRYNTKAM